MIKNLNNRKKLTISYFVISIVFFVISLKFSGAEAYHRTGMIAYIKWMILGALLNSGYLIPITKLSSKFQFISLPLMLLATFVNVVIYGNPNNFILYNFVALILISLSAVLVLKKVFKYGQNLYA